MRFLTGAYVAFIVFNAVNRGYPYAPGVRPAFYLPDTPSLGHPRGNKSCATPPPAASPSELSRAPGFSAVSKGHCTDDHRHWRRTLDRTMLRGMENHRTLVMLDPTTDQILAECNGPTATGRCPAGDSPPYVCAGLHLVGVGARPAQ